MAITCIKKYDLNWDATQKLSMPIEKKLLHVGLHDWYIRLWCAINPDSKCMDVEIRIVDEKEGLPNVGSFLGTVIAPGAVVHIFTGPGDAIERAGDLHYATKRN